MADEGVKKPLTAVVYCGASPGKNPVFGEKAAGECTCVYVWMRHSWSCRMHASACEK